MTEPQTLEQAIDEALNRIAGEGHFDGELAERTHRLIRLFGERCAQETANRINGESRPSMTGITESALASPVDE